MSNQPDRKIEGVVEQQAQRVWASVLRYYDHIRGKQIVVLSQGEDTENHFNLIPEPPTCTCGNTMQKEFRDYSIESKLLVVRADWLAGYGCSVCPLKAANTDMVVEFDKAAIKEFEAVEDTETVKTIIYNDKLIERNRPSVLFR